MRESATFIVIALMTAAVFVSIGVFALNKKTPMNFWVGTTVESEEISDIKAYNKENGIMWILYGMTYIIAAIYTLLFGTTIGAIMIVLSCTIGLGALIVIYGGIYKK